jgi:hypothetical protein
MRDTTERFEGFVDRSGECHVWTGCKTKNGYGRFQVGGRVRRAHRMAWELANGPVPSGLVVCHHCDNPTCVNLTHLFIGTTQDNVSDKVSKGRHARGEMIARAKMTAEKVQVLRFLRSATTLRLDDLAMLFGLSFGGVRSILDGRCWAHVAPLGVAT